MLRACAVLFLLFGAAVAALAVYGVVATPNPALVAVVCGGPALGLFVASGICVVADREERNERAALTTEIPQARKSAGTPVS